VFNFAASLPTASVQEDEMRPKCMISEPRGLSPGFGASGGENVLAMGFVRQFLILLLCYEVAELTRRILLN
jgi:hypothetical protein